VSPQGGVPLQSRKTGAATKALTPDEDIHRFVDPTHLRPHCCVRHTHQLRPEGVDIGIISKQYGHRSITTTACYLDHICPMAAVEGENMERTYPTALNPTYLDTMPAHEVAWCIRPKAEAGWGMLRGGVQCGVSLQQQSRYSSPLPL